MGGDSSIVSWLYNGQFRDQLKFNKAATDSARTQWIPWCFCDYGFLKKPFLEQDLDLFLTRVLSCCDAACNLIRCCAKLDDEILVENTLLF